MSRLIKVLKNKKRVVFDKGNFDDWCVYVVEQNESKKAYSDFTYFSALQKLADKYTDKKIYNDFVAIYSPTSKQIDARVLGIIDEIVKSYELVDQDEIEQWFTVLYGGMIAEGNKKNTKLGKRIKRLGMHQTLMLEYDPREAANYSRGKNWRALGEEMEEYGF